MALALQMGLVMISLLLHPARQALFRRLVLLVLKMMFHSSCQAPLLLPGDWRLINPCGVSGKPILHIVPCRPALESLGRPHRRATAKSPASSPEAFRCLTRRCRRAPLFSVSEVPASTAATMTLLRNAGACVGRCKDVLLLGTTRPSMLVRLVLDQIAGDEAGGSAGEDALDDKIW